MTRGVCIKCFSLCTRRVSGKRHEQKKKKKKKAIENISNSTYSNTPGKICYWNSSNRSPPELYPHMQKAKNKITSKSYCLDFFFCNFYWLTLFFCHENQEFPYHFGIFHDSLQVHRLTICKQSVSNTIYGPIPTADQNYFRRLKPLKSSMINLKHSKLSLQCMKNNPYELTVSI